LLSRTREANMEIRNQSKTGLLVPPLADLTGTLSHQIDGMTQRLLDRLKQDPASFAQIEAEIHGHFRHLADQMTASLLAQATNSDARAKPEKKGGLAATTNPGVLPRRGG
jgi:DNA-nicking Smr family endonuclease